MPSPDTNASTRALVVIAHGSRAEAANAAHVRLCQALAARVGTTVWPAFLELAEPDLGSAVRDAADDGARSIGVLPYFLHPGNHTSRDIPALIEQARLAHPDVEIHQLDLFGADPVLVDVLAAQVRR